MSDSEAKDTMENAQEDSEYHSEFTLRVHNTLSYNLDFIQTHVENYGIQDQINNIRSVTQYIDMLQKMLTLGQQMEEQDNREKKKKRLNKPSTRFVYPSSL